VDEEIDFREIARDGGTVLSNRAGDFIFREGDAASFVVTIPERKAFGMLFLIDKKLRANAARAKEDCTRRADLPHHDRGNAGFRLVHHQRVRGAPSRDQRIYCSRDGDVPRGREVGAAT
jgi:hypothetical protein